MVRIHYNKLIRDGIPSRIRADEREHRIAIMKDREEFHQSLANKLVEEAKEYQQDKDVKELADIMEIIDSLLKIHGLQYGDLKSQQEEKHKQRGGFEERLKLEWVDL